MELIEYIEKLLLVKKLSHVNNKLKIYEDQLFHINAKTLAEKAYLYYHKIQEQPKCVICNNDSIFDNIKQGFHNTCNNKFCKNK